MNAHVQSTTALAMRIAELLQGAGVSDSERTIALHMAGEFLYLMNYDAERSAPRAESEVPRSA